MIVLVAAQLALVFFTQKTVVINVDGIFSYTLSNNPYTYVFIDDIYEAFPNNNGWIDARILKENYVVETYDRFNYGAVYHHQRYDVHPPLYYFAVHTVSSLFPGAYSNMFTLGINLAALLLADLLVIRLFKLLYGSGFCGLVPLFFLVSMEPMRFLFTWARMYMLLFLFCLWYLYIHARLVKSLWRRRDLIQMVLCIFLGTMTHYYFYVYAGALTLLALIFLIRRRRLRALLAYMYAGVTGFAISWIFYPWALFHIFLNAQNKHADVEGWSLEKGKAYAGFLVDRLFGDNGAGWVLLLFWCAGMFFAIRAKGDEEGEWRHVFRKMAAGSGLIYSLVIYTLDGGNLYYMTALYMAFIVWASMVLLDLCMGAGISWKKNAVRIGMALIGAGVICSGTVLCRYVSSAGEVLECMYEGAPLADDFRQTPAVYHDYSCLYIEKRRDNLFHNYWFDFGQYRRFKKISMEEFSLHGIGEEELRGCEGEGIVVYAPKECELDGRRYRRIAEDADYRIYEYLGGGPL